MDALETAHNNNNNNNNALESDELSLRRFQLADAPFIIDLLNDPLWISGIGDRNIKSIEDAERYLTNGTFKMYELHGFGSLLVSLKSEDNRPIGMCGLFKRDYLEYPDIGFAFLSAYCGQGHGKKASLIVLDYCQHVLKLEKMLGILSPTNTRSLSLLSKLGFVIDEQKEIDGRETVLLHKDLLI